MTRRLLTKQLIMPQVAVAQAERVGLQDQVAPQARAELQGQAVRVAPQEPVELQEPVGLVVAAALAERVVAADKN